MDAGKEPCASAKTVLESEDVETFVTGASRIRDLPPEQFCSHGFVLGKTAEAGFGNEMYKVLTAAALSIMLNRSLIIGQTRHIGSFPSLSFSFLRVNIFLMDA
ncbi:hypothetical protein V8G54_021706 [Vigna mungo]|uniref:Uncharacterized protein n=1 Tax=Vigna mungo TaxID=3915 RepID=A0AAQ3NEP1_VIGMU